MARLRILVLFAHPALEKSRVHRRLVEAVQHVEGVELHDLYELYPDYGIDIKREQALVESADLVVFQHPFYWYSTPARLKEWQDLVLEHGWAYGGSGAALHGKRLLSVITTGGGEESYCREGYNHCTMRELLAPIEYTARLCGMDYLPPYVIHGTHRLREADIAREAEAYRRTLEALRDGALDLDAARRFPRLNSDLGALGRG